MYVLHVVIRCLDESQTIENQKWFKLAMEQRLKDLWRTTCYRNITMKQIRSSYRIFKVVYGIEDYLVKLLKMNRIYITKMRAGNNKLPLSTGRCREITREERCCDKCDEWCVGDDLHVLLLCRNQETVSLRN